MRRQLRHVPGAPNRRQGPRQTQGCASRGQGALQPPDPARDLVAGRSLADRGQRIEMGHRPRQRLSHRPGQRVRPARPAAALRSRRAALLQERGRKVQIDKFQQWIDVKSVNNDGTIAAVCYIQIMKQDDAYQFFVRMKLRASGKAVAAKLGGVIRDLEGACALTESSGLRVCAATRTEGIGEDMTTIGRTSLACPTPSPVLA
jgi:hypothetical protein